MSTSINKIKLKGSDTLYDIVAKHADVATRLEYAAHESDQLVAFVGGEGTTAGYTLQQQDLSVGRLTNEFDFYVQQNGVKISGLTTANWDRAGLPADHELYIGGNAENLQIGMDDLSTSGCGKQVQNSDDPNDVTPYTNWNDKNMGTWSVWKAAAEELTGKPWEGDMFVLDQCTDAKRIKIELPEDFEFDYFTVTGVGHNNGATSLTPCNDTLLSVDDPSFPAGNKNTPASSLVTRTFRVLGKQRRVYYLYCSTAKKIWAQIRFYKQSDDANPYIPNYEVLMTNNSIEHYTIGSTGIPQFSGLTIDKTVDGVTTLIGACDNQGPETTDENRTGIYVINSNDVEHPTLVMESLLDIEGLCTSPTALYACIEHDGENNTHCTNDIIRISKNGNSEYQWMQNNVTVADGKLTDAYDDYDYIIKGVGVSDKLLGEKVSANQGFEGIAYYETTEEDGDILLVGNQNKPISIVAISAKKQTVLGHYNFEGENIPSEIAGLSYDGTYLWLIDSLTGAIWKLTVDHSNGWDHMTINIVKQYRMVFQSGGNENCESIAVDAENRCFWVGTEIGTRLYKIPFNETVTE